MDSSESIDKIRNKNCIERGIDREVTTLYILWTKFVGHPLIPKSKLNLFDYHRTIHWEKQIPPKMHVLSAGENSEYKFSEQSVGRNRMIYTLH